MLNLPHPPVKFYLDSSLYMLLKILGHVKEIHYVVKAYVHVPKFSLKVFKLHTKHRLLDVWSI